MIQVTKTLSIIPDTFVYTIGYEGIALKTFLRTLKKNGIKRIIDVRRNPISRKPGFSKNKLKESLNSYGIDYVHFPELGIPSSMRCDLNTKDDYVRLFDKYENEILPNAEKQKEQVIELLETMPSALLCFEHASECCHRTRLAQVIAKETGYRPKYL
jgi:uncharacterized protein (DUF488 family)